MKGSEILKQVEDHCGEKLECSKRLRFHIEQTIQRLLDQEADLRANIGAVLNGHKTFDPTRKKVIASKK